MLPPAVRRLLYDRLVSANQPPQTPQPPDRQPHSGGWSGPQVALALAGMLLCLIVGGLAGVLLGDRDDDSSKGGTTGLSRERTVTETTTEPATTVTETVTVTTTAPPPPSS